MDTLDHPAGAVLPADTNVDAEKRPNPATRGRLWSGLPLHLSTHEYVFIRSHWPAASNIDNALL
jgi:hypothetical protein